MLQNDEFIREFAEEALGHVERVEKSLLNMEKGEINNHVIDEMMRSTHSIKGAAGFFQLRNIVDLSHAMESLFGKLRDGTISINQKIIDSLLAANDYLKDMVKHADDSERMDISMYINSLLSVEEVEAPGPKAYRGSKDGPVTEQTEILQEKNWLTEGGLNIDDEERAAIEDALRHGHRLYRVSIGVNNGINIITIFKKVQTIGNIIEGCSGFTDTEEIKGHTSYELQFLFLFTSVLEKALVSLALDISEEYIVDLGTDIGECHKVDEENKALQYIDKDNSISIPGTQTEIVNTEKVKKDEQTIIEDSVRVHTALLDDLLNLAGEIILSRNRLLQWTKKYKKDIEGLDLILKNAGHITKELQEKIMQTRMQPVSNVFNKFPRIVRELSRKLGKEVVLKMEGMDVGLDKSIIESLTDPLTHIMRNAIDHGIEKPEVRVKEGKQRTGTVIMKASHEGGYVKIDITDDGAGIDAERIKEKAVEKGIVKNSDLSEGDRGILDILFMPGFSTAEEVTDISGRGVGMDVVKINIEKLGGSVEVDTTCAKGTTFRLILPLTVAIIPSLIVETQTWKYAVPQVNLQEIIRIKPEDREKRIQSINNIKVLRLRDDVLPVINLSSILGAEKEGANKDADIIRILIMKVRQGRLGLIVDTVHDSEEILVKPLPAYMKDCELYSGVTILSDGRPAMIIDPEGMASKANFKQIEGLNMAEERKKDKVHGEDGKEQDIILFKCSGPETFGMDFSMISRVEEIDALKIEIVGEKEYINYRGNPIRVIRPEDYLPVRRVESYCKKAYVIIPKHLPLPVGILIERVYDNIKTQVILNEEAIKGRGLLGSCIINDKIVLLMDMDEIFREAVPEDYARKEYKMKEPGLRREEDFS